jgi:hypothetical protein
MAKAISDRAHDLVERFGINVESKAKDLLLLDVGQLAVWHWRSNFDQG